MKIAKSVSKMGRACAGILLLILPAAAQPVRLMVVGVDGLGAFALREKPPAAVAGLMQRGAWTLKARGVLPTVSSPNWASMIMGAGPEWHGVTSNDWQPDKFDIAPVCKDANGRFPTVFGWLREMRPELTMVVIHDWEGFGRLVGPGTANEVRHVKGSAAAVDAAIEAWKGRKPDLLFLHLDDLDHAGHDSGWETEAYRKAVMRLGTWLERLVDAAGPETYILLTGDHGGTGTKHGNPTQRELEIPWMLAGPGIAKGREIRAAVSTTDTAATIGALFGLEPHPCWTGRPVKEALPKR